MHFKAHTYIFILLLFSTRVEALFAHDSEACLSINVITVYTETYNLLSSSEYIAPMISKQVNGYFTTKVNVSLELNFARDSVLQFQFEDDGRFVGIPYRIYMTEVTLNDRIVYFFDMTNHCSGPGVSLYIGQTFTLFFKLEPELQKECADSCKLGIRVWGLL